VLDDAPSYGGVRLDESDPRQTVHGETLGTLGYMPPEQARGELDALDVRTDVYALGAILFELLTLEPLHVGQTPAALFSATLKGAEARASLRAPHRNVPRELEAICVRATRSAPEERYASARELNDEIEAFLDRDLDLERRRAKAAEHAHNAANLAKRIVRSRRAGAKEHEARSEAMREVNAALALDPDNRDARASLWLLLTVPPAEMPPEAEAEVISVMQRDQRLGTKSALIAISALFVVVPMILWVGVRSWVVFGLFIGTSVLLAAGAAYVNRRPRADGKLPIFLVLFALLFSLTVWAALGPFIVFPTVLTAFAAVFSVGRRGKGQTPLLLACSLATYFIAVALELTRAVPPSMTFGSGGVTILPRSLALTPLPTEAFFTVTHAFLVAIVVLIIGRFRNTLWDAERKLTMQSWQLQQLFPPDLRVRARQLTGG
jgi:eukaryotic-like serine/threonine-protein kinase